MDDYKDFLLLCEKWHSVIHEKTFDSGPIKTDLVQARIAEDHKAEMAYMARLTGNINLRGDANKACNDLAHVGHLLQLSHVSFATITSAIADMQQLERVSRRVTKQVQQELIQAFRLLGDIETHVGDMSSKVAHRKESVDIILQPKLSDDASNFVGETIDIEQQTIKKIIKYTNASQILRQELEDTGVFSLCPDETIRVLTSPGGIGPLPHSALSAYSLKTKRENAKVLELEKELTTKYGYPNLPMDLSSAEEEARCLREECMLLEERLNEAVQQSDEREGGVFD